MYAINALMMESKEAKSHTVWKQENDYSLKHGHIWLSKSSWEVCFFMRILDTVKWKSVALSEYPGILSLSSWFMPWDVKSGKKNWLEGECTRPVIVNVFLSLRLTDTWRYLSLPGYQLKGKIYYRKGADGGVGGLLYRVLQ